jgi:hypothetical protein
MPSTIEPEVAKASDENEVERSQEGMTEEELGSQDNDFESPWFYVSILVK